MAIPVGPYNYGEEPQGKLVELMDLLRERPLDGNTQDFIREQMLGKGDNYAPPDYGEPYEEPSDGSNDPYQVAGEVVRGPLPRTPEDLRNATTPTNSSGMQSIGRYGGPKNPYLDLLDILAYPQGGQIRR